MRYFVKICRWLLCLILLGGPALAQEAALRVVQWSDIHGGGVRFSTRIFQEAVRDSLAEKPDVIVITGDNGDSHEAEDTFVARLDQFMATMVAPLRGLSTPVMLCLGNNDLRLNYQTDPDVLEETAVSFRKALGQRYYLDALGNGVYPDKVGGYSWISLNSQIFSPKNHYRGAGQQARQTLDWLRARLQEAAGGPVVLMMHIPPAHDVYDDRPAWRDEPLRDFLEVVRGYPGDLRILAGHFHRNEIHAIEVSSQRAIPVMVAGSLSLKHGYIPNWRIYHWKGRKIEYTVRYPGHAQWTRTYSVVPVGQWFARLNDPKQYKIYLQDLLAYHHKALERSSPARVFANVRRQFWIKTP